MRPTAQSPLSTVFSSDPSTETSRPHGEDHDAMTILSRSASLLPLTTLLGFLDFRICAANKARSFRSR
jgi:hypothetical protein